MNNERGEISLTASLILWISFLLLSLLTYRLEFHHRQLRQKLRLNLCTKEVLGLTESYWANMSQLNWGINNATKAQVVTAIIPGLQGVSMKVSKVKQALQKLQTARTVSYLVFLAGLKRKGCSTPLSLYRTPFEYSNGNFKRNMKGVALMRDRTWTSLFSSRPYVLVVRYELPELKVLQPKWKKSIMGSKAASL